MTSANLSADNDRASVVIECRNLSSALTFYQQALGFRLDAIFPADAPRIARLSGHDISVQLQSAAATPKTVDSVAQDVVVSRQADESFGVGRAGMLYRDLIPHRFGGNIIASHIRIADAGPVPDFVHHHGVDFQLIYCVRGWVDVLYEDQGERLRLTPGDCFLQPPHIRHRVMEASAGLEVVEISCPAEHETLIDHELTLPTGHQQPDRDFGGQRFVYHRAADVPWRPWGEAAFEHQSTAVAAATGGTGSVDTVRVAGTATTLSLRHDAGYRFVYVLDGSAALHGSRLTRNDALTIPANADCDLRSLSSDFCFLHVMVTV